MDASEVMTVATVSPDNSEVSYTVPDDTCRVVVISQTDDAALVMRTASGGTGIPLPQFEPLELDCEDLSGRNLYFYSTGNPTVTIISFRGRL